MHYSYKSNWINVLLLTSGIPVDPNGNAFCFSLIRATLADKEAEVGPFVYETSTCITF